MTEDAAKEHLREMLATLTAGSVLHLLAEVFREDAEVARRDGNGLAADECENIEATLFVVGLGIDAARPR